MKNFIKAHPYLSCSGLALATDALGGLFFVNTTTMKLNFPQKCLISLLCTTVPSMVITAIDQYGHQYLTESKPLQYTLTAVESVLFFPSIVGAIYDNKNSFKDLIDTDLNKASIETKAATVGTLIQSLGFKYILDLANEQSQTEIELERDDLIINDESIQNDHVEGY